MNLLIENFSLPNQQQSFDTRNVTNQAVTLTSNPIVSGQSGNLGGVLSGWIDQQKVVVALGLGGCIPLRKIWNFPEIFGG